MSKKSVLFIHGGGPGAYEADLPLAESLQNELGSAYELHYPRMPLEEEAGYLDWKARIAEELAGLKSDAILVAHSVGGSILLKFLSEEYAERSVAGLFLIATPFFGGDENWNYDELILPPAFAVSIATIPRIFLYHSRDDETVPFAHLALYAAKLPWAVIREFDGRGHQFGNDLTEVAHNIKDERT